MYALADIERVSLKVLAEFIKNANSLFENNQENITKVATKIDLSQRELIDIFKQSIETRTQALDYGETFIKRVTGVTSNTLSSTPNAIFQNPQDKEIKLFSLIIVPEDANTRLHGIIEIRKGEARQIFPANDAGSFGALTSLQVIPPECPIKFQKGKLEIYVKNDDGITAVNFSVIGFIGEYFRNVQH